VKPAPKTPPALEKPRQPGRIRAVFLAVLVHAAFFALIVFGVSWQSSSTPPVQAELWDKLPPVKKAEPDAPKAEPPKPEPEPPKPEPAKPEPPKPEPPKPEPEPPKPEPAKPDPAIALKLEREKLEREKRERLERQKEEAKKKREQEEAAKKKQAQEDAAKKKREEDKRKHDEEVARREAEKARAEAASQQQREIESWIGKIKDKIRGRANVPDTVTGNPEVSVRLHLLPGGEVLDITITKTSGNPSYDNAIDRAIRSASPLPVPQNPELFSQFRDLKLQIRHEK
jgi:colicin import membrane protein